MSGPNEPNDQNDQHAPGGHGSPGYPPPRAHGYPPPGTAPYGAQGQQHGGQWYPPPGAQGYPPQSGYPQQGHPAYPPPPGTGPPRAPGYGYQGAPGHKPPSNGLGIAALIVGLVALLFGVIPFVGIVGIVLGVVGVILGIIALARVRNGAADNKGMSIAGLVLSALAILAGIISSVVLFFVVDNAVKDLQGTTAITYEARSSTGRATVGYDTDGSTGMSIGNEVSTPWTKNVPASNLFGAYLSVSAGPDGGSVTCRILGEDGDVLVQNTAQGQFASATCSASLSGS